VSGSAELDWTALSVCIFFFALVTVMGFWASRWQKGTADHAHLDEWGLGGRNFGTWITWFLVGGDFYTAYTVIAVPAQVFAIGAQGFFALPYTIVVYPIVFAIMPRLWSFAQAHGHVTAADVVYGRYGSRWLELAVAATGLLATMPYIALQLVGMEVVIKALGLTGRYVDRRRQPVHPQCLEGLCKSGRHPCRRGIGREDHQPRGQGRRAAVYPIRARTIRARSAVARRVMDPADVSGGRVRAVLQLVPRSCAADGLGG